MEYIVEGKARIMASRPRIVDKSMPVFYNPVMKLNRDLSILLLAALGKGFVVADPLAGSGIRTLRFLCELPKGRVGHIFSNDIKPGFSAMMKRLVGENGADATMVTVTEQDANVFLTRSGGFDYIDIDPFGSPNPFLDASLERLSRGGVLAITATDTSSLAGSYPKACMRKYWAKPLRNELKHEVGLRILIRKAQLVGAQYDKALIPVFSYSRDHYMRVFLRCEKSKKAVDGVLSQHGMLWDSGPFWQGQLWDGDVICGMREASELFSGYTTEKELSGIRDFLSLLADEARVGGVGFHDLHAIAKDKKLERLPKTGDVVERLVSSGHDASKTHFSPYGVRSGADISQFL